MSGVGSPHPPTPPRDKDDDGLGTVEEDVLLRQLENTMLNPVSLHGVPGIHQVFFLEDDKVYVNGEGGIKTKKEWVLETDSVNLKVVVCVPGVDFTRTYSEQLCGRPSIYSGSKPHTQHCSDNEGVIESDSLTLIHCINPMIRTPLSQWLGLRGNYTGFDCGYQGSAEMGDFASFTSI